MKGLLSRLKKIKHKKYKLLLLLFFLVMPNLAPAHALFGIPGLPSLSKIILGISSTIASIVGAMIAFVVYFITAILLLSFNLSTSDFVARGFKASLSIVNLGFVLGLIVIAIATILRVESYAMKRTLRNFILAAFLVNFSLVIAGSVIKFGDNITLYIIQSGFPSNENKGSISNFADSIGKAFGPQKYILINASTSALADDPQIKAITKEEAGILPAVVSLFTSVMGLTLALVAMCALFVMLLYRYVLLTGLLIVMPFAWLLWIFPSTASHWTRWWSKFLGQVFFPPVALFGVWLVVVIGINTPTGATTLLPGGSSVGASLTNWLGEALADILTTFMNGIVLSGLMLGALSFAAKMGEESAQVGMKWAQGAKNAYVGYVGGRAKEYGRRTANRAYDAKVPFSGGARPIKSAVGGLQSIGASDNKLLKYTGIKAAAGKAGRLADRAVTSNREALGAEARERSKNMSLDEKIRNHGGASFPEQLAWTEDIKKEGRLNDVKNIEQFLDEKNKDNFASHGQGKLFSEARNESGLVLEKLVKELKEIERVQAQTTDTTPETLKKVEDKEREVARHISTLASPDKLIRSYLQKFESDYKLGPEASDAEKKAMADKLEGMKSRGEEPRKAMHGLGEKELDEVRQVLQKALVIDVPPRTAMKVFQEMAVADEYDLLSRIGGTLFKVDIEKMNKKLIPKERAYNEDNFSPGLKKSIEGIPGQQAGLDVPMLLNLTKDERKQREEDKKDKEKEENNKDDENTVIYPDNTSST